MDNVPENPKIYHIVHVDRLPSIVEEGYLWCDAEAIRRQSPGTTIGMNKIKERRLNELALASHPGLHVGDCVPFYFCPRSIMLFLLHKANHPELAYRGGQGSIIHLEADLKTTVAWAEKHSRRWAFTLSNAGARYFEDRADLRQLAQINWNAVHARIWKDCPDGKQAEFLIEEKFPWELVSRIGVQSRAIHQQVRAALYGAGHRPTVDILLDWYY